jgi:hypothetical protein
MSHVARRSRGEMDKPPKVSQRTDRDRWLHPPFQRADLSGLILQLPTSGRLQSIFSEDNLDLISVPAGELDYRGRRAQGQGGFRC